MATTIEDLKLLYPILIARIEREARGETVVSVVTIEKDEKGRTKTWTEESRDLDGSLVSKRMDKYTYYLTGEINEIVQEKYKGKTLVSKQKIKHYRDGVQPNVMLMSVEVSI